MKDSLQPASRFGVGKNTRGLRANSGTRAASLLGARQDGLKMRGLFFAGNDADFDLLEARLFQPAMQIAFREARPAVTVKVARLREIVQEQIEYHDLPAATQHFERRTDCVGRNDRM